MKLALLRAAVCLSALSLPVLCHASAVSSSEDDPKAAPRVESAEPLRPESESSSATLSSIPDAPSVAAPTASPRGTGAAGGQLERRSARPFSAFAIELKLSTGGVGFDLATPLATKLNLRGGGVFFGYSPNLTEDGLQVTGSVKFSTVDAHIDYFPFGGSFRISPGVTFYNGNKLNGVVTVPGGSTFTLNDVDYTSSSTDPVKGSFNVQFGKKVAPSLTTGFGNMLPRKAGKHFSVPFEIGFEYINTPSIALNLSGTACLVGQPAQVGCAPIQTDPQTQMNVQQEQQELNSDISGLRFYPIVSIGLAYKF